MIYSTLPFLSLSEFFTKKTLAKFLFRQIGIGMIVFLVQVGVTVTAVTLLSSYVSDEYVIVVQATFFFFCIITDTAIIAAMRNHAHKSRYELQLAISREQRKFDEQYFLNIKEVIEKQRKQAHDWNNILSTLQTAIQNSDDRLKSESFLNEVKNAYTASTTPYYCDNLIANTILSNKSVYAENAGIEFEVHTVLESDPPFGQLELCMVLSNIIDNAIEAAAELSGEKKICLKIWSRSDFLFIRCSNPVSESPPQGLPAHDKRQSRKDAATQNNHEHGYGLQIVSDVAEKYGGNVTLISEDGYFTVTVALNRQK